MARAPRCFSSSSCTVASARRASEQSGVELNGFICEIEARFRVLGFERPVGEFLGHLFRRLVCLARRIEGSRVHDLLQLGLELFLGLELLLAEQLVQPAQGALRIEEVATAVSARARAVEYRRN